MTVASKSPSFLSTPKGRVVGVLGLVGAVVGFSSGWLIGKLEKLGALSLDSLGWSDVLSGFIALMLTATGLLVLVAGFSRKVSGRLLDPVSQRDATPAQASYYRQQGLVSLLAGLMLLAPILVVTVEASPPFELSSAVMAGIVALFLLQTLTNLTLWFRSDELVRRVIADTGAVTFWILQGALFLWAAGEKLGLLPQLALWDAVSLMMAAYLLIATLVSSRRGFGS